MPWQAGRVLVLCRELSQDLPLGPSSQLQEPGGSLYCKLTTAKPVTRSALKLAVPIEISFLNPLTCPPMSSVTSPETC